MKTSFIIGWVCLFISLVLFDSIISQGSGFSGSQIDMLKQLMQPTGTDITALNSVPIIGGGVSMITGVWAFFKILIEMIFLFFPNIWAGNWIWLWAFLCVPVSIGFIVSFIIILRRVHST